MDIPEIEVAMAACEWGELFKTDELDGAVEFVQIYSAHDGTASRLDEAEIRQLYRARLRCDLAYELHHAGPLESLNDEDRTYRERQVALYFHLQP